MKLKIKKYKITVVLNLHIAFSCTYVEVGIQFQHSNMYGRLSDVLKFPVW